MIQADWTIASGRHMAQGKVEKTKAETGAKVAKAKAEATIMEKKATGESIGIWKWLVAVSRLGRTSGS